VGTSGTGGIGDNGNVQIAELSCTSDGNCSAGGYYYDGDVDQAFVDNEVSGVWATPIELTGTTGTGFLGDNDYAEITSLSCSSDGNCSAGGYYYASNQHQEAFVVNEVSGTWGTPTELVSTAGTGGLGDSNSAEVQSLSCSSDGNCGASGFYYIGTVQQAFVVNEVSGTWGTPTELVGTAGTGGLGDNGDAEALEISCPSDGNCSAGGYYHNDTDTTQAFVVNESSGTWGTPTELVAAGGADGFLGDADTAQVTSLSCSSAGNCSAGGFYDTPEEQAFVVSEVSGVWGAPTELPAIGGAGFLGDNDYAYVAAISCPSDGNCSAGGYYYDSTNNEQAFVINESAGVWGAPAEVVGLSGTGGLGDGNWAELVTLSCSSAGNCSAGGRYSDGDNLQAFVVNEVSGTWGTPVEISGLNGTGGLGDDGVNAETQSLSCSSDGYCGVGGIYDVDDGDQAFVTSSSVTTTTTTTPPPPPPTTSTTTTTTTTTTVPPATTTTTTTVPVKTHPRSGLPVYVYFANDKAVLSTHDKRVLNALARSLMASGTTHVRITGYANYLGTDRINLPLSLHRANVTRNYLTAALAARGDTGVSFTVSGRGVLRIYSPIALDRVAIVTR
jgi:outer membrane protein OmpA-like peptidoglycan-associated protein